MLYMNKLSFRKAVEMLKLQLLLVLTAGMTLVGCTSDDLSGTSNQQQRYKNSMAIDFKPLSGTVTRGESTGAEAAGLLNKKFVVTGYKGPKTNWEESKNSIVFDNYLVEYIDNTSTDPQSDYSGWEYVDKGPIKHAIAKGITSQKIKYWDHTAEQYDFIAWSTGLNTAIYEKPETGIPSGSVFVSAITPTTATGTEGIAYTLEGASSDLSTCYIADLVTVKKTQYGDNPVMIAFRHFGAKVRFGIYETIPGYSVRDVEFYSGASSNDVSPSSAIIFTASTSDICHEGRYTVYYPVVDGAGTDNNQAHVKFDNTSATFKTTIDCGALNYTTKEDGEKTDANVYLGRSSKTPTYAGNASDYYYLSILPNESGTNLTLRVNYTLESTDGSGETITVKGATAHVPSIYTKWMSGYAYTYLFKISDKTNGHTGVYDPTNPEASPDPAGLYPITFDAVVEKTEDNNASQETITHVSTPSITTYQKGSNVVSNDEYTNVNDIFVTVNENNAIVTLTGKASLYTIPSGTTEGDVVETLQCRAFTQTEGSIKGHNGIVLKNASFSLKDKIEYGVDGNAIILSTDQALCFTPEANTTYAFVYTKTEADPSNDIVRNDTSGDDQSDSGKYVQNDGIYYTKVVKIE